MKKKQVSSHLRGQTAVLSERLGLTSSSLRGDIMSNRATPSPPCCTTHNETNGEK